MRRSTYLESRLSANYAQISLEFTESHYLLFGILTMSEEFSAEISSRICKHMNEDHSDAVVLYAKAFGGVVNATTAQMLAIDSQGMDLTAQVNEEAVPIRVPFDHTLVNAEDAHHTLIAMIKQARMQAK